MNETRNLRVLIQGTLVALFALINAPESLAQDLTYEVRGVVATNTITTGPFATALPGEPSTLRLTMDVGSIQYATTHLSGGCPFGICNAGQIYNSSSFDTDMSSVQFSVGGFTVTTLPTSASEVTLVNDFGGRDLFKVTVGWPAGSFGVSALIHAPEDFVFHLGDPASGTGVTTIPSGPSPPPGFFKVTVAALGEVLEMTPTEIEVMSPFQLSCHGDGGNGLGCTDCPCSNNGTPGHPGGCLNSSGSSVLLYGQGIPSVSADTFQLRVKHTSEGTLGFLVSGGNQLAPPGCPLGSGLQNAFDDGLRCIGGAMQRHGPRVTYENGYPNSYFGLISQAGFTLGQVRHFQYVYRDDVTAGCQTGRNSSNALTMTIVP